MLKPLMQFVLNEELKAHPEKEGTSEKMAAELAQELLEELWQPEKKPITFLGKVKSLLSDGINLPQVLFDRIIDFKSRHQLTDKKEEMRRVMFYTTKAFNKGTDILAAGCYLFYHNPKAFEKYAISSVDFNEDIRLSSYDKDNDFMPLIALGIPMAIDQAEQNQSEEQRLPLISFAPIRYGFHPSQEKFQGLFEHYNTIFSERSLYGFHTNPSRYEPLNKLLHLEHPESHYPAIQHNAMVIAINEFNKHLAYEPVKVCSHKGKQITPNKQKTI